MKKIVIYLLVVIFCFSCTEIYANVSRANSLKRTLTIKYSKFNKTPTGKIKILKDITNLSQKYSKDNDVILLLKSLKNTYRVATECDIGFYLKEGQCLSMSVVDNGVLPTNENSTKSVATDCKLGTYLNNGKCIDMKTADSTIYQSVQNTSRQEITCGSGTYLVDKQCISIPQTTNNQNTSNIENKKINGVCGDSNNSCFQGNTIQYIEGVCGTKNTWTCTGQNGGNSISCGLTVSACKAPRYPGCDKDDIALGNGQVWAACNVGASISSTEYSELTQGDYFQWGNNANIMTSPISSLLIDTNNFGPNNPYFGTKFITINSDWSVFTNNNLWGDITNTSVSRKGPCEIGYHIPSQNEWCNTISFISPQIDCTSYVTSVNLPIIRNTLKLPLSGWRVPHGGMYSDGELIFQGKYARYWTSSKWNTSSYNPQNRSIAMVLGAEYFGAPSAFSIPEERAMGYPIRCIKD